MNSIKDYVKGAKVLFAVAVVAAAFYGIGLPAEANHTQTYPQTMGGNCTFDQQYFSQVDCANTPGNPQQCANPPSFTKNFAQSHTNLLVQYSTVNYGHGPMHCSSVGVDIYMDGVLISNTPMIAPESVSPWISFGPVAAGNHVFTVQGTGTPGGCNIGALKTWGGTLNFADAGVCTAPSVTCSTNSQCGTSGYNGGNFCQGNGVYRNYTSYTCNNPGTAQSFCSSNTTAQLQQTCSGNQTCSNGTCNTNNTQTITCSTNSQCGTNGTTGGPFCQGNGVYQNQITYTCNNPGTAQSYCSSNTTAQLQSTCSGNQTCNNGSCNTTGTVTCSSNSQCGTDAYTGGNFCQGNGVYRNYTSYTCNNPGTTNSYCSTNTTAQQQSTCSGNQTCSNGTCNTNNTGTVTCSNNSQCGTNGVTGANYCSGNSVYQNYTTYTCNNPGTTNSYCSSSTTQQLQNTCSGNQTCSNGVCNNTNTGNIACSNNSQCGTSGVIGSNFCSGNAVYQNYVTYTCNNPGTTNSYCSSSTANQLQTICSGSQTCNNGSCNTNNQTGNLLITKQVRNLSAGNLTWASSVNAAPGDILQIQITLQNTGTQSINNVTVRDTLPNNISYYNNLFVDGVANNGNIVSGINIGSITANQTRTITYQVQVAPAANFSFGTTTLTNSITVTGDNFNNTGTGVTIYVTRSSTGGATGVPTGLTNNPIIDSFFLPLVLALAGIWLWKSGYLGVLGFAGLSQKVSHNKLMQKIAEIKSRENA